MTTFLLVISLIVNSIAIFAIIILYMRQNRLLEVEKKQEKMIHDMEESISAYLIQMKEENENFINRIKKMNDKAEKHELISSTIRVTKEKTEPERQVMDEQQPEVQKLDIPISKNNVGMKQAAVKAYQTAPKPQNLAEDVMLPPITDREDKVNLSTENDGEKLTESKNDDQVQDLYMESLYNQVIIMKKQGLSEDEIAKKLNKGKTEIELLLKFRQK